MMNDGVSEDGVFPVVVVKVNELKFRAPIDLCARSSYVSAKLIDTVKIKPSNTKQQQIDMLINSKTAQMEIYDTEISL